MNRRSTGPRRHPRGRRLPLLVMAMTLLLAATGCQDWVAFMGGGGLTGNDSGETTISASNVGQLAQAFSLATPNNEIVIMDPVESGGVVYGGTANGHLFASTLNGNDASCSGTPKVCQPLWTASDGAGDGFVLSPAVSGGRVFAEFQPDTPTDPHELAAFDAAGVTNCSGTPVVCQPLWSADVVSLFGPNVADGKVFITGVAPSLSSLGVQAYDAAGVQNCSGTPTVCQPLWTALGGKGTPAVSGGKVYTTVGNDIAAYDENGVTNCSGTPKVCQPLFTVHNAGGDGSVDISNGVGYVETSTKLVAFDASGVTNCSGSPVVCQPLWTANLFDSPQYQTPAVAGGRVYTGESTTWEAFDANGATNCSGTPLTCKPLLRGTAASSFTEASPVVANGLLLFDEIFDATGASGCTGSAPAICTPLSTIGTTGGDGGIDLLAWGTLFTKKTSGGLGAYQLRP